MLAIEQLSKNFISWKQTTTTLQDINIEIKDGEFICLVGPSGCGKSTLLNIIAGLEKPSAGGVFLNGNPLKEAGPDRAAVMFQESALFPWLNVLENVEFGMKMAGIPAEERQNRAIKYLKLVQLSRFSTVPIHTLSGGMRQRVALARALAMDSRLLLMDEPFSALDSQTKEILQLQLQQIWWETKKTIIFVTHDVEEAVLLGDRVIVMAANPGRIKKDIKIHLGRPRQAKSLDVTYVVEEVKKELREEVERVAKAEYDSDWSIEKISFLANSSDYMADGI
ncbi:MAG TPA: ABC transporter ATP-binding protein [Desulfobacteria bacterium]|nr:ABC transporter ATP-binding protein [Desulfobacteria bacterium]